MALKELSSTTRPEINYLEVPSRHVREVVYLPSGDADLKRGELVKYDVASKKIKGVETKEDEVFGVLLNDVTTDEIAEIALTGKFNAKAIKLSKVSDSSKIADYFLQCRKVGIFFDNLSLGEEQWILQLITYMKERL